MATLWVLKNGIARSRTGFANLAHQFSSVRQRLGHGVVHIGHPEAHHPFICRLIDIYTAQVTDPATPARAIGAHHHIVVVLSH